MKITTRCGLCVVRARSAEAGGGAEGSSVLSRGEEAGREGEGQTDERTDPFRVRRGRSCGRQSFVREEGAILIVRRCGEGRKLIATN